MAKESAVSGQTSKFDVTQFTNATPAALSCTDGEVFALPGEGGGKRTAAIAYAPYQGKAVEGEIAVGEQGSAIIGGAVRVFKKAGLAFLSTESVWWDASANQAVKADEATTMDDFVLGVTIEDSPSTETWIRILLNRGPLAYSIGSSSSSSST